MLQRYFIIVCWIAVVINSACLCTKPPVKIPIEDQFPTRVKEYSVDGLKVLTKPSSNGIITVQWAILGGTANYSLEKSGIEKLALHALVSSFNHDSIQLKGIEISDTASYDFSAVTVRCRQSQAPEALALMQRIMTSKTISAEGFEAAKKQQLQRLADLHSDESYVLVETAHENMFTGRNYAKKPEGTETIINLLSKEETQEYLTSVAKKETSMAIIIGDADSTQVFSTFAPAAQALPTGGVIAKDTLVSATTETDVDYINLATDKNQLLGMVSLPALTTRENRAMALVWEIVAKNIRNGLSTSTMKSIRFNYSSGVRFINSPYAFCMLETNAPAQASEYIMNCIKAIKAKPIEFDELQSAKAMFLTAYYTQMQSNAMQGFQLAQNQSVRKWIYADGIPFQINNVSKDEVNNALTTLFKNIHWTYIGDKQLLDEKTLLQALE